jgi:16S rRNA (guanine966-N2)-methyltransferase
MRIIAGTAGGCRLTSPSGLETRPTADRVKAALFSIVGPDFDGARVLDLYAGSGSLGVEALSRGAQSAVFVERDADTLSHLRGNLGRARLASAATVVAARVEDALDRLFREQRTFDLILADPPYGEADVGALVGRVARLGLLAADGILVVEHAADHEAPEAAHGLARVDSRRYGRTALSFYRAAVAQPAA